VIALGGGDAHARGGGQTQHVVALADQRRQHDSGF